MEFINIDSERSNPPSYYGKKISNIQNNEPAPFSMKRAGLLFQKIDKYLFQLNFSWDMGTQVGSSHNIQ